MVVLRVHRVAHRTPPPPPLTTMTTTAARGCRPTRSMDVKRDTKSGVSVKVLESHHHLEVTYCLLGFAATCRLPTAACACRLPPPPHRRGFHFCKHAPAPPSARRCRRVNAALWCCGAVAPRCRPLIAAHLLTRNIHPLSHGVVKISTGGTAPRTLPYRIVSYRTVSYRIMPCRARVAPRPLARRDGIVER